MSDFESYFDSSGYDDDFATGYETGRADMQEDLSELSSQVARLQGEEIARQFEDQESRGYQAAQDEYAKNQYAEWVHDQATVFAEGLARLERALGRDLTPQEQHRLIESTSANYGEENLHPDAVVQQARTLGHDPFKTKKSRSEYLQRRYREVGADEWDPNY